MNNLPSATAVLWMPIIALPSAAARLKGSSGESRIGGDMQREWVQIVLVLGLMTTFGLGGAAIALTSAQPDDPTTDALASLGGGILFGVAVGVVILISLEPTQGSSLERALDAVSRRINHARSHRTDLARPLAKAPASGQEQN